METLYTIIAMAIGIPLGMWIGNVFARWIHRKLG